MSATKVRKWKVRVFSHINEYQLVTNTMNNKEDINYGTSINLVVYLVN